MFDAQDRLRGGRRVRSGATRARASWSTCSPSGPTSSSATRAAPTPAIPSSSATRSSSCARFPSGILHPDGHLHRRQRRRARAGDVLRRAGRARRARHRHRPAGSSSPTGPTWSCRSTSCSTPPARRARTSAPPGRGIGPAYEDKYGRRGIRVADLRHLDCARGSAGRPGRARQPAARADGERRARLARASTSTLLERLAPRLLPLAADTGLLVHRALRGGKRVLLEGAQGALLDVDHGTYPFVTSSNTTAGGAAVGAGIGPTAIDGVLGVVKAYTTRVGNGPLPTEAESPFGERLRELGGEFGVGHRPAAALRLVRRDGGALRGAGERPHRPRGHQAGRARHLRRDPGVHRVPARRRAVRGDARRGRRARRGSSRSTRCIAGWRQPTGGARTPGRPADGRARLPRPAEALSGRAVRYVSVGTRRDQIIEV